VTTAGVLLFGAAILRTSREVLIFLRHFLYEKNREIIEGLFSFPVCLRIASSRSDFPPLFSLPVGI